MQVKLRHVEQRTHCFIVGWVACRDPTLDSAIGIPKILLFGDVRNAFAENSAGAWMEGDL